MICSQITLIDDVLGMSQTKFDKNLGEFLENFSVRMGEVTAQDNNGFIAKMYRNHDSDLIEPIGSVEVLL